MNIKPIKVTRTFYYGFDTYLEWCEEEGIEPTQEGFLDFVTDDIFDDFCSSLEDLCEVKIEEIGQ